MRLDGAGRFVQIYLWLNYDSCAVAVADPELLDVAGFVVVRAVPSSEESIELDFGAAVGHGGRRRESRKARREPRNPFSRSPKPGDIMRWVASVWSYQRALGLAT